MSNSILFTQRIPSPFILPNNMADKTGYAQKEPETVQTLLKNLSESDSVDKQGGGLVVEPQITHKDAPRIDLNPEKVEYTDGEILDWLITKFQENYFIAKEIIPCESSWQADIVSPTGDVGLFGINLKAHWDEIPGENKEEKTEWLKNPYHNIDFAHNLYLANGWDDWGTSETSWGSYNCWSKKI